MCQREDHQGWSLVRVLPLFLLAVLPLWVVSCGESDDEAEYANWADRNATYFNNLYQTAQSAINNGSSEWKIFQSYSLNDEVATDADNHIVVRVLEEGKGSGCPMFTDSVLVHYRGRLMPSKTYPDGLLFDQSFSGNYNIVTMLPSQQYLAAMVSGYTTALLNMHIGDRWLVYIPSSMGYGSSDHKASSNSVTIPGGSVLVFDLTLVAYYRAGTDVPSWNAKATGWWIDE